MVLNDASEIEIVNLSEHEKTYLTIDGQLGELLKRGDSVRCRRSEFATNLIQPPTIQFFDVLREKLEMGRPMINLMSRAKKGTDHSVPNPRFDKQRHHHVSGQSGLSPLLRFLV